MPPRAERPAYAHLLAPVAAGSALVLLAVLAAVLGSSVVARQSPPDAYLAFWVAHALLGLAFFAIGFLARAALRHHAAVGGLAAWGASAFLMDNVVRWRLFRTEGYHNLTEAGLPAWFFVAQALSPVSGYRATLILWRPGFRDYLEKAALDGAPMPPWLSAPAIAAALLVLWVLVPLAIAILMLRLRQPRQGSRAGMPEVPGGLDPDAARVPTPAAPHPQPAPSPLTVTPELPIHDERAPATAAAPLQARSVRSRQPLQGRKGEP